MKTPIVHEMGNGTLTGCTAACPECHGLNYVECVADYHGCLTVIAGVNVIEPRDVERATHVHSMARTVAIVPCDPYISKSGVLRNTRAIMTSTCRDWPACRFQFNGWLYEEKR